MSGLPCLRVSAIYRELRRPQPRSVGEKRLTIDDCTRRLLEDRVDEFIAERLPYVRGRPQEADGNGLREDARRAGPDTTASRDEHDAAEQRCDAKYPIARHTADPEVLGRLVDHLARPVARLGHHERVARLARLGDRREPVPLRERAVGDAREVSGLGRDYERRVCVSMGIPNRRRAKNVP